MNFYDNIPNPNNNFPMLNPQIINNDIIYKINELENRLKKLELRISYLEQEKNNNYIEPDNKMYML